MPIAYHISEHYRVAVAIATGVVSHAEIAEAISAALADPALQVGFSFLSDFHQARLKVYELHGLLRQMSLYEALVTRIEPPRRAVVVGNSQTRFLARSHFLFTSAGASERQIFEDPHAARLWVGLPADYHLIERASTA